MPGTMTDSPWPDAGFSISDYSSTCTVRAGPAIRYGVAGGWASSQLENYSCEWLKWDTLYSPAPGFLAMRGSVTGDGEREGVGESGRETGGKSKNRSPKLGGRYNLMHEPKTFGLHIFCSISLRLREPVVVCSSFCSISPCPIAGDPYISV